MNGQAQLALLPDDPLRWGCPAAAVEPIRTAGRIEYAVHCDGPTGCGAVHRHIFPGKRRGPCGAAYTVPGASTDDDTETADDTS